MNITRESTPRDTHVNKRLNVLSTFPLDLLRHVVVHLFMRHFLLNLSLFEPKLIWLIHYITFFWNLEAITLYYTSVKFKKSLFNFIFRNNGCVNKNSQYCHLFFFFFLRICTFQYFYYKNIMKLSQMQIYVS